MNPNIRPEFAAELRSFEQFLDANGDGIPDNEQVMDPELSQQAPQREPSVRERLNAERQRRGMGDVPLGDIETGNVQTTPEEDDLARGTLATVGGIGAELTGVPAMMRGGSRFAKGVGEGDGWDMLAGAGEAAAGMIPGAAMTRAGARAIAPMFSSAPAAAGSGLALGATQLPANVSDAHASSQANITKRIQEDPRVIEFRRKIERVEQDRSTSARTPIKGMNQPSADAARARADKGYVDQLDGTVAPDGKPIPGLRQQLADVEQMITRDYMDNAPFRERNPGTAQAIQLGSWALAGGLPFASHLKGRLADALVHAPSIRRTAQDADNAFFGTPATPGVMGIGSRPATLPEPTTHQRALTDLNAKVEAWGNRNSQADAVYSMDAAKTVPLSAFTAFEGAALPEHIDAASFTPGHPTREQAINAISSGQYYLDRVPAALLQGAGLATTGRKAADLITPSADPMPMANAALGRKHAAPPNPTFSPYPGPNSGFTRNERQEYLAAIYNGGNPNDVAAIMQRARASNLNLDANDVLARVGETQRAVNKFVASEGRVPLDMKSDRRRIFDRTTLGIAGAAATGAAMSGADEAEASDRPSARERYEAVKAGRPMVARREMMSGAPDGAADFDPKAGRYRRDDGTFMGF